MEELIREIREEFQIPPYFPDTALQGYIQDGIRILGSLNPGQDYDSDRSYRMLLKNYAYYAFHHRVNEFMENYSSLILQWQLESEVPAYE